MTIDRRELMRRAWFLLRLENPFTIKFSRAEFGRVLKRVWAAFRDPPRTPAAELARLGLGIIAGRDDRASVVRRLEGSLRVAEAKAARYRGTEGRLLWGGSYRRADTDRVLVLRAALARETRFAA